MNSMAWRIAIAAVVAMVVGVGIFVLKGMSGATKEVTLPERSLETLPMELGTWKGETTPPDDKREDEAVGAQERLYRTYRDPSGSSVSVHAAAFGEYLRSTPHSPLVCFPSRGWNLVEDRTVTLPGTGDPGVEVELATFEQGNRHVFAVFWYQLGDEVCFDMEGLSAVRRKLRSRCETWPSTIKFLLEAPMVDPEEDEARLLKFAGQLYQKSKELQGTSYIGNAGSAEPAKSSPAGAPAD